MLVEELVTNLLFVDVDQIAEIALVEVAHVGQIVRYRFDDHVRAGLDLLDVAEEWHNDIVVRWLRYLVVGEDLQVSGRIRH